jgi:nickel and cobalt resistance protein CnrR
MTPSRTLITAVLVIALALVGVWFGRLLQSAPHLGGAEIHALMHDELDLDAAQERALTEREREFSVRRTALEAELKRSNARLGKAISAEHEYGPRVSQAVDASHHAMGELQKATLEHVFAMRAILRPEQQARFDAVVEKNVAQTGK